MQELLSGSGGQRGLDPVWICAAICGWPNRWQETLMAMETQLRQQKTLLGSSASGQEEETDSHVLKVGEEKSVKTNVPPFVRGRRRDFPLTVTQ